eukprot:8160940-Alexandrium_andersonii.AAC.1
MSGWNSGALTTGPRLLSMEARHRLTNTPIQAGFSKPASMCACTSSLRYDGPLAKEAAFEAAATSSM